MKNIAVICHGGNTIGMGHVIRSLSLAQELKKRDYNVFFISKYREGIIRIKQEHFEVIELPHIIKDLPVVFDYGNETELEEEEKVIEYILLQKCVDTVIIDSYNVTRQFFINIKKNISRVIYIDDIYAFDYPVDVIINGNITGPYLEYKKTSDKQKLLLGLEYNLIRNEFQMIPKRLVNEKIQTIMITTGAADPYNITTKIVNTLLSIDGMRYMKLNVIVGNSFNNTNELDVLSRSNDNITLFKNPNRMSDIMLSSDIAISACGSTLYELSACGTPIIGFVYADNQKLIAEKMEKLGYIKYVGYYSNIAYDNFVAAFKGMDYAYRKNVSLNQQKLVDGKGTKRVVDALLNL